MGGGSKYSLCGARAARRYLILVNMVTAIAGLLFIVIGAISLVHGEGIKKAVDEYCLVECGRAGCAALECSGRLPSCDCSRGQTQLPGYFYAPASGLIAVGVFSLITPLLGCIAAIRHQAAMLCLYIIAASFVLILQFSFGVAAAAVASMDRVPERMQLVFNDQYRDFDWKYLKVMRVLSVCGLVCVTHTHTHTHRTFFPPRATRHTLRRPLPTAKRLLMCKQVTRRVRGITRVRMRRWRGSEAIAATRPASVPLASTRRSSAPAPTRMRMHVYMHNTNV